MISADLSSALANHLWQSTLFAAMAGLLTLTLKNNHARARYWLWLIASMKFLIPFSLLVAMGGHFGWSTAQAGPSVGFSIAMEQIGRPFLAPAVPVQTASLPISTAKSAIPMILFAIWICGFLAVAICWVLRWKRIHVAVRAGSPLALEADVPVRSSPALLEPGIFGIIRPVLLLPEGITDRLTPEHVKAILAHELCHVRRRDNLSGAIHMAVEAIFWFHPLIWWLGVRLIEERERACDEEVLRLGNEPEVYAESILKTCQFYLESPLACVSGVTGSDLKQRIVRIMTQRVAQRIDFGRKLLLAAAALLAIGVPIVFGLISAPQSRAQSPEPAGPVPTFEVASIKPSDPSNRHMFIRGAPGGRYTANGITVKLLIENAYDIHDFQISGGPNWLDSAKYDIVAKAPEEGDPSRLTEDQREAFFKRTNQRLQSLLADRFQFKFHTSTKELPIYALVTAKSGPKLQSAKDEGNKTNMGMRPGQLTAQGISMSLLAANLSNLVSRVVLDKTGLSGRYDFTLEWTPDRGQGNPFGGAPGPGPEAKDMPPPPDPNGPSIFTAVQEQLRLKLEPAKGPVEILVVDQVEKPSEN